EGDLGGGADREGARRGARQARVRRAERVRAGGADGQAGRRGDAAGDGRGGRVAAAHERPAVERQGDGGGALAGEDVPELVAHRDGDGGREDHAGLAVDRLLREREPRGRRRAERRDARGAAAVGG